MLLHSEISKDNNEIDYNIIREMTCGVILANEIRELKLEIANIIDKANQIEYNELLKVMSAEDRDEIIHSRSMYDNDENSIEKIKVVYNIELQDQEVIEKLTKFRETVKEKYKLLDQKYDQLMDLGTYAKNISESIKNSEIKHYKKEDDSSEL